MTQKRKILVIDDNESFLKRIKRNIKKFNIVTTTTLSGGIKLIRGGDISFIVVDITLKGQSRGSEIFYELFHKGIAIPGILITGHQITTSERKYLKSLGALEILQKAGGSGPLSSRIEDAALKILEDRNNRFVLFSRRICEYKLGKKTIDYNGKPITIQKALEKLSSSHMSIKHEDAMIKTISDACNAYLNHKNDSDYIFPQI